MYKPAVISGLAIILLGAFGLVWAFVQAYTNGHLVLLGVTIISALLVILGLFIYIKWRKYERKAVPMNPF